MECYIIYQRGTLQLVLRLLLQHLDDNANYNLHFKMTKNVYAR